MENLVWGQLSVAVRERLDELVRAGSTIPAMLAIRDSGLLPKPSLSACQDLLAWRRHCLGATEHHPTPEVDKMIDLVGRLPWPPDAIEAIWDGDTEGWCVALTAVSTRLRTDTVLGIIRHGGDIRLFQGTVPPWPEAQEASVLGGRVAEHLNIPFHFVSPEVPDDEAPRLWDR